MASCKNAASSARFLAAGRRYCRLSSACPAGGGSSRPSRQSAVTAKHSVFIAFHSVLLPQVFGGHLEDRVDDVVAMVALPSAGQAAVRLLRPQGPWRRQHSSGFRETCRLAAQNAAVRAKRQPVPVTALIIGWPLRMQKARSPSATMSMAPVTATTAPVRAANALANATVLSSVSSVTLSAVSASTPFVVPLPAASVRISEMLPRMTVNFTSRRRRSAVSVRRWEAPAPTGSSTLGPSPAGWRCVPPAWRMVRLFNVPMLRVQPGTQRGDVLDASAASSAMMGTPAVRRLG